MSSQNSPQSLLHDAVLHHINPNFVNAARPWPPGFTPNPGGRPSYRRISDACFKKLDETDPEGATKAEKLAGCMVDRAIDGDVQAAVFVRDTTEGRPLQQIDLNANLLVESSEERKNRMLAVLTALATLGTSPDE